MEKQYTDRELLEFATLISLGSLDELFQREKQAEEIANKSVLQGFKEDADNLNQDFNNVRNKLPLHRHVEQR